MNVRGIDKCWLWGNKLGTARFLKQCSKESAHSWDIAFWGNWRTGAWNERRALGVCPVGGRRLDGFR